MTGITVLFRAPEAAPVPVYRPPAQVCIRIPEQGETPLSLAEQRIAVELGIRPKRRYSRQFAWREVARAPAHFAEGSAA